MIALLPSAAKWSLVHIHIHIHSIVMVVFWSFQQVCRCYSTNKKALASPQWSQGCAIVQRKRADFILTYKSRRLNRWHPRLGDWVSRRGRHDCAGPLMSQQAAFAESGR
ncbi:hypothetical protein F4808DRAFT_210708 [Astrocystis sublimbata]|nr:hypothetical protein F4808DRAFT_210708 [Astrocystis sublimbata]